MKLHELKRMVKEEFDKFVTEEDGAEEVEISVNGEEGSDDDILRQIYDLLATHFEGGEDMGDAAEDLEDMGDEADAEAEEVEDEDEEDEEDDEDGEEEELEELSNHGVGKPASKSSGKDAGYKAVKEGKKKQKNVLQERFKKLANII